MRKGKANRREVLKASIVAIAAGNVARAESAEVADEEVRRDDPAPQCGEIVPSGCLTRDQVRWLTS